MKSDLNHQKILILIKNNYELSYKPPQVERSMK